MPDASDYLTLAEAAQSLPGRVALSTLHRWRLKGVRGRKLRTTLIGGRRYTTREWLADFVAPQDEAPVTPTRTNRQRQQAVTSAERELEAAGI